MPQPEGIFIEWKAEEILMLDGQNNADQEWAVVGSSLSVGYKPDKDSDACEFSILHHSLLNILKFKLSVLMLDICFNYRLFPIELEI